ncbi:hypothetical protein HDU97_001517 [Phlyctochytrium planicorne]|nr:hypothetical protein HDU97_001517 [Phlyctochytrium planicorne]
MYPTLFLALLAVVPSSLALFTTPSKFTFGASLSGNVLTVTGTGALPDNGYVAFGVSDAGMIGADVYVISYANNAGIVLVGQGVATSTGRGVDLVTPNPATVTAATYTGGNLNITFTIPKTTPQKRDLTTASNWLYAVGTKKDATGAPTYHTDRGVQAGALLNPVVTAANATTAAAGATSAAASASTSKAAAASPSPSPSTTPAKPSTAGKIETGLIAVGIALVAAIGAIMQL